MSLRLTKPGMRSANLAGKRHPKTGELLTPLGYLKDGTAVWPVMGASEDDPDDPHFTGQEDDEDDEDEGDDEDDEDDFAGSRKSKSKSKKSRKTDDDEDDEDEEDSRVHRASQQAKRYRLALRAKEKEFDELKARLQAIEDEGTPSDEIANRHISELKKTNETLTEQARVMTAQLAFFKSNTVPWIDPTDAFALAERAGLFDDIVDDDGTVDERELRRGLKDLARRKPHLVRKLEDDKKARGRNSKRDDDEDEEDENEGKEQSSRRTPSASKLNGKRKGSQETVDRAALAKSFPVLNRF